MQVRVAIDPRPAATPFGPRNVAVLLGVLLVIAYFPILIGGQTLCYRDFGVLGIPTAAYDRAAIRSGEIPLWNPYSNCGTPFLAQWGTMVLYPLSLLYVLLPMPWSLNLFCLLHLWIGAMGMYCLARRWLNNEWPAALAAVAFLCNGITQASLSWPNYAAALGLLPWVVFTIESTWQKDVTRRQLALGAGVAACQLLTGVPELAAFTWILLAALWLRELIATPELRARLIARQIVIVGGAALLCAAQLLPFFELLHYSHRTPGFAGNKWALPIWGWADFLLPRFHTFTTPEGTVFQYGQEFLSSVYLGGILLILASFSLTVRNWRVITFIIVSLSCAVLAFGSTGYVYPVLLKILPPLGIARYPVKFLFLLAFTVPMLSACGANALAQNAGRKMAKSVLVALILTCVIAGVLIWINAQYPFAYDRVREFVQNSVTRVALTVIGAAALILAATGKAAQTQSVLLRSALLAVLAFDGFTHLKKQNPTVSALLFQPDMWATSENLAAPEYGNGRVFITPEAEARLLHNNVTDIAQDLTGKRLALWSHLNLLDHIPKVNGSATLQLRDQAQLQSYLYSATNNAADAWLDFLNVTLRTSSNSIIEWQSRPHPMPFITGGQKPVPARAGLLANPINFAREVSLEPWLAEFEQMSVTPVLFSGIEFTPERISFTARVDKPAVIVLPQSWHPAWHVQLSRAGEAPRDVPLLKANSAFQALVVPAGETRVRLSYQDWFFWSGAAISILTLLAGALLAWKS